MTTTTVLRDPRRYKTLEDAYNLAQAGKGNQPHKFHFGGGTSSRAWVDLDGWVLVAANNQEAYPGTLSDSIPAVLGGNSIIPKSVIVRVPDVKELRICTPNKTDLLIVTKSPNSISRFSRYYTMALVRSESDMWSETSIVLGSSKNISNGASPAIALNEAIFGGDTSNLGNELNWRPIDSTSQILKGQNTRLQLWMRWNP